MTEAQTNEYNCGPTALSYFLALAGHMYSPNELEAYLKPTPELGTMTADIEVLLNSLCIPYYVSTGVPKLDRCNLPILVNVNHELDGDHYMIVTEIDQDENLTLWDPYYGEFKYWPADFFRMNHYSPLKKLTNWSLYLT